MASMNYGRERPTPPHVQAHDNPAPVVVNMGGPPNVMPEMEAALRTQNKAQARNNHAIYVNLK